MKVKKLFSIDQAVDNIINRLSKSEKRTKSSIVEIAIIMLAESIDIKKIKTKSHDTR